jgi:ubiquinone/menaquinone biosynthesis C-methylase UbiE
MASGTLFTTKAGADATSFEDVVAAMCASLFEGRRIADFVIVWTVTADTEKPFQKDLSHLRWEEVHARQALRADLVDGWMEALNLRAGERVLEIGAGPGFFSLILAERVGPSGLVYAVEPSAEALAYLQRLRTEQGVFQIEPIAADATTLQSIDSPADCALVTMVLHHAEDPAALLRNVRRLLRAGGRIVIGDFHPDGPGKVGAPKAHRIAPEIVKEWCRLAGLTVVDELRQTPEHYIVIAERRA